MRHDCYHRQSQHHDPNWGKRPHQIRAVRSLVSDLLCGGDNYSKAFYLPTKADLYVSELRQWVNLYHADPFADRLLPPASSRSELLDRYHSHTENCRSCSQALKNIKKIKQVAIAIPILVWTILPLLSLAIAIPTNLVVFALSGTLLVSSLIWWQLNRIQEKFYRGQITPPRNLPGKQKS